MRSWPLLLEEQCGFALSMVRPQWPCLSDFGSQSIYKTREARTMAGDGIRGGLKKCEVSNNPSL